MKGKSNATAASMAHPPEEMVKGEQAHAHSYPGKKAPKAEKVTDAQHNQAAHEAGRKNSLGVSADGSHKGLPVAYEKVGSDCSEK
jgi:hypothetical protein